MSKYNYKLSTYPNYPEFQLLELYPACNITYSRGNEIEDFFREDFLIWQDFFCNKYRPIDGTKILLFHCCSWSKPYDFSYIVNPIRKIAKKYKEVHRAIISNVGVVPYEYQMNETFCTYDFPPVYDCSGMDDTEISRMRKRCIHILYERIYTYLKAQKNNYKLVITYSVPQQYSMAHLVGLACKELDIPFTNGMTKEKYIKYKNKNYEDAAEIYIEKELLEDLDLLLEEKCAKLK